MLWAMARGPAVRVISEPRTRRKGVSVKGAPVASSQGPSSPELLTYSRNAADKLSAYRMLVDRIEALLEKHPEDADAVKAALRQIEQFDRSELEQPQGLF